MKKWICLFLSFCFIEAYFIGLNKKRKLCAGESENKKHLANADAECLPPILEFTLQTKIYFRIQTPPQLILEQFIGRVLNSVADKTTTDGIVVTLIYIQAMFSLEIYSFFSTLLPPFSTAALYAAIPQSRPDVALFTRAAYRGMSVIVRCRSQVFSPSS